MNYINKGKRDILIFPKFENLDKIQTIRLKYDELANILPAHITIVYPFKDDMTNDELKEKLIKIIKDIKPFKVTCNSISIIKDEKINKFYAFLNIDEGREDIKLLHDKIYEKILYNTNEKSLEYTPHITLGNVNENEIINLEETFETIVDTISVETIGENEESNIEFEIKLI